MYPLGLPTRPGVEMQPILRGALRVYRTHPFINTRQWQDLVMDGRAAGVPDDASPSEHTVRLFASLSLARLQPDITSRAAASQALNLPAAMGTRCAERLHDPTRQRRGLGGPDLASRPRRRARATAPPKPRSTTASTCGAGSTDGHADAAPAPTTAAGPHLPRPSRTPSTHRKVRTRLGPPKGA